MHNIPLLLFYFSLGKFNDIPITAEVIWNNDKQKMERKFQLKIYRFLHQQTIRQRDGDHGFHNRDHPRADAGIMAAFDLDRGWFVGGVEGFLEFGNGRRRFYRDPQNDILAIRDAA